MEVCINGACFFFPGKVFGDIYMLDPFPGSLTSHTPCIGWERKADHTFDHQLWALKNVGDRNAYTLMSFRSGLFIDLEGGCVDATKA